MINNTFTIVIRPKGWSFSTKLPSQDRYGWEEADTIMYDNYEEAKKMLEEYRASMGKDFNVSIRARPWMERTYG